MKKVFTVLIMMILISLHHITYANWGWDYTDDPEPYYHQEWGKWYYYDDTKVFMVQVGDSTYKYVFDDKGNFINGWVTSMPMRLP